MKKSTINQPEQNILHTPEVPQSISQPAQEQFAYLDLLCAVLKTPLSDLVESMHGKTKQGSQVAAS